MARWKLEVHVAAQRAITEEFMEEGEQHIARAHLTHLCGPGVMGSFQLRVVVWERTVNHG